MTSDTRANLPTEIRQLLEIRETEFDVLGKPESELVIPVRTPEGWRGCDLAAVMKYRDLLDSVLDMVPEQFRGSTNPDGSLRFFWLRELNLATNCVLGPAFMSQEDYFQLWGQLLSLGAATGRLIPVLPPYSWAQLNGLPPFQLRHRQEAWEVPPITLGNVLRMERDLFAVDCEVRRRMWERYGKDKRTVADAINQYYSLLPDALFIQADTAMRERAAEYLIELNLDSTSRAYRPHGTTDTNPSEN